MITHLIADSCYTRIMSGNRLVNMVSFNLKQMLKTEFTHFVRLNRSVAVDMAGAVLITRDEKRYIQLRGKEHYVTPGSWPLVARALGLPEREIKSSEPQARVLSLLSSRSRLHISELAELTSRTPSSTSTLVKLMQKKGMVQASRDRSRVYVSLAYNGQ